MPLAPRHLPGIGHAAPFVFGAPWDVTERWLRQAGPTLRFNIPGASYVLTGDLEAIRRVLVGNAENYLKDMRSMGTFHDLLGQGLLTSDGPLWKRQRTVLAKAFRIDALRGVVDVTRRAVDRASAALDEHARAGRAFDVGGLFRKLTLQVIAEATLSMGPDESDEVFPRLYEPLVEECNKRVWLPQRAWLPLPARFRYDRAVRELDRFLAAQIEGRRAARAADPKRKAVDMLDMLLVSYEGEPWSAEAGRQISDEVKTMLFAGHDTSSAMLTWTLHALTKNPETFNKLRRSADEAFPGDAMPDYETLKRLEYAGACLKEALRIFNIVPVVTRKAVADDAFGAFRVPAGSLVMLHLQALHRDPRQWPAPETFRPERFVDGEDGGAWLPFISGPRSCVGQHFSLLEAKIVLSLLCRRFDFTPEPGNSDARHRFNIPVGPRDGIAMRVRRRGD
ncbi:MAG: cytochrome P450 [Myxococcales bacterium]|nr:cytochrome P450 [Myxococcales bacterium]